MRHAKLKIVLALLLTLHIGWAQSDSAFRLAFYNVENLFDTADDPVTMDEEFTPEGDKAWTQDRFQAKLDKIAQVMTGMEYPAIMGFCEVENKAVLTALCEHATLKGKAYTPVHFDSPDLRGIDVALLYQKNDFELLDATPIRIDFPSWLEPESYTSRDILHVTLRHTVTKEVIHVFVNHWPSRRGGGAESEHRRLWVSAHLRRAVDAVLIDNPLATLFIMGDFNDEPRNRSLSYALGTLKVDDKRQVPGLLYNAFLNVDTKLTGSYNYKGQWNMLDQIIYAGLQAPNLWRMQGYGVFRQDWLLYKDTAPNRTYGGNQYYGGYSDHLPVYLDVVRKE
ncbi:MAG: endonuclease [Saprospiraceae bacterium]